MNKLEVLFYSVFIIFVIEKWLTFCASSFSNDLKDLRENSTQNEELSKTLAFVFGISNQVDNFQINLATQENKSDATLQAKLLKLRDISNFYYLPVIVTIGIVGNILTIIILVKEKELSNLVESNRLLKTNSNIVFRYKRNETLEPVKFVAQLSTNLNHNERKMTLLNQHFRFKSQFSSTSYFII